MSEIIPADSPPSFAATFSLLVRREIMSNSSAPKRSIVTGAASGIGYAIAERLIADGGSVVAFDLDSGGLDDAAKQLGDNYIAQPGSVTDANDIQAAVARAESDLGGLDSLFNVAGAIRPGPITDLDGETWDFTVDIVLRGVFLCTKYAAQSMIRAGNGGSIVVVSSVNAHIPLYGGSAYAAGKAGADMFAKNAALELGATESASTRSYPVSSTPRWPASSSKTRESWPNLTPTQSSSARPSRRSSRPPRCSWLPVTPATSPAPASSSTAVTRSVATQTSASTCEGEITNNAYSPRSRCHPYVV